MTPPGSIGPVSVVVPTRRGGELLALVVESVLRQSGAHLREIVLVDSGSSDDELDRLERLGARIERIEPASFQHGRTRDLGAARSTGEILVFLNQDALPTDDLWLERLTAPFGTSDPPAAVQGGILEFPGSAPAAPGRRRFFWDSCGPRFYFTSESETWIAQHGGIGFSTVNCAIARSAWERLPFGSAEILEDKLWQQRAWGLGWRIEAAPAAAVWHTHDYRLRALAQRCSAEGSGWRYLGVRYPFRAAWADLRQRDLWREWRRGWRSGEMRTWAERLFPIVRPVALWWGNRRSPGRISGR